MAYLKGTEITTLLRQSGAHPHLIKVIEAQQETIAVQRKQILQIAEAVGKVVDTVNQLVAVNDKLKNDYERLRVEEKIQRSQVAENVRAMEPEEER